MLNEVVLRAVEPADLPVFFAHQLDPVASRMAAFTAADPGDRDAFMGKWERMLADDALVIRTILANGEVVGHAAVYLSQRGREVTYWIGREHWGRGIASAALGALIAEVPDRPLIGAAAADNLGSLRVLEKNGFRRISEERAHANARGEPIPEIVMRLA